MKPSSLAKAIEFYLEHRRQLGFLLKEDGGMLRGLARYAAEKRQRGPLTIKLALAWAQAPSQASPLWWARRLDAVRRFATFWRTFDPRTQLPPPGVFGPSYVSQKVKKFLPWPPIWDMVASPIRIGTFRPCPNSWP